MQKPGIPFWLLHAGGWLAFFGLPFLFIFQEKTTGAFMRIWETYPVYLFLIFYPAAYYFMRWLLQKKQSTPYSAAIITLFTLAILLTTIWLKPFERLMKQTNGMGIQGPPPTGERPMPLDGMQGPPPDDPGMKGPPPPRFGPGPNGGESPAPDRAKQIKWLDIVSVVLMLITLSVSMAIHWLEKWKFTELHASKMAIEKTKAELESLKAQVNPHFLFNVLNNLYAMAQTANPNTADGIMHLSNLMRYITDEATEDKVPLEDELRYISDYIALQQLRIGSRTGVVFSVSNTSGGLFIAPLLLIPLVENVFKHGISNTQNTEIIISIQVKNNILTLRTRNMIFEGRDNINRQGIGLQNLRKRLDFQYPDRYTLHLDRDGNYYMAELILNLL